MPFLYNQNQMRRDFLMPQPQQQMPQAQPQIPQASGVMPQPPQMPQPLSTPAPAGIAGQKQGLGMTQFGRNTREVSKEVARIGQQTTPFFKSLYESMRNVDPEQREAYLQNAMSSVKERLDRYEFRLARGIPLSAGQQAQYNALRASFNDIQSYIKDPQIYEEYFSTIGDPKAKPQQYRLPSRY